MRHLTYVLACGTGATLASFAAIMINARHEGKSIWQPVNATSHWLWGPQAGALTRHDLAHTWVGGLTNIAASGFWGAIFGAFLATRRPRRPAQMLSDAAVVGAVAGVVDYGLVPKRLTPGWELALSDRAVVLSMAAMTLGLALGGLAAQTSVHKRGRRDA